MYIQYQTLLRRINHVPCSPYYLLRKNLLRPVWLCKWYSYLWRTDILICCLPETYDPEPLLRTVWSCKWYFYPWRTDILIHVFLEIYNLEPYLIYNLVQLNDIMWNTMFNACVESRKYCSHILACIDNNNRNVFTTVLYINIYLYNITRVH